MTTATELEVLQTMQHAIQGGVQEGFSFLETDMEGDALFVISDGKKYQVTITEIKE